MFNAKDNYNWMESCSDIRDNRWAVLRLSGSGLRSQIQALEASMRSEATEFLRSPPKVKQLCVFERKG